MSFDRVAPAYDRIARLVFGKAIIRSQIINLDVIKDRHRILIVGGGTGWILNHINRQEVEIDYVEESVRMISKAKHRSFNTNVTFIHQPFELAVLNNQYDVIIVNFFFDLYSSEGITQIINKINKLLRHNGLLLVTDFINSKWWHLKILSAMYFFFRMTANLKTNRLATWWQVVGSGYQLLKTKTFYNGFIHASVFTKHF